MGEKTNAHRVLIGKHEEAVWKILRTGKDNIKMNPKGRVWVVVVGSSEKVHVARYCKHGNGAYGSTNCAEFFSNENILGSRGFCPTELVG